MDENGWQKLSLDTTGYIGREVNRLTRLIVVNNCIVLERNWIKITISVDVFIGKMDIL